MLSKRVFLFLLAAILLPVTVLAQISGDVTTISGDGIAGIEVNIYDLSYNWVSSAVTDSNGDYTIANVANGHYKVEFYAGSTGYATEWYSHQSSFNSAEEVVVSDPNSTIYLDTVLVPGGSLAGTVSNDSGDGIANVQVQVYQIIDSMTTSWVTTVLTAANGEYSVTGLWPVNYKIEFLASSTGYANQWYDNQSVESAATPVSVVPSQVTADIDAVLAPGGSISGTVTDDSGNGLSGITIYINDTYYQYFGSTVTEVNGDYIIQGLPVGGYKIGYSGSFDSYYLSEWYDDTTDFNSAAVIQVTTSQDTPDIDAVLELGGKISGTVTDASGNGINSVHVQVYDSFTHEYEGVAFTTNTGEYLFPLLPPGNYLILFDAEHTNHVNEWYDDAKSMVSATPVIVTAAQETTGINAVLEESGTIIGKVTDSGGTGLWSIRVQAYNADEVVVATEFTDHSGNYSLLDVPPGNIKVKFSDYHDVYEPQWYNKKKDFASADILTIVGGNQTTGIDIVMRPTAPVITPIITPILMLLLGQ